MRIRIALLGIALTILASALLYARLSHPAQTLPVPTPLNSSLPAPSEDRHAPIETAAASTPAGWTEAPNASISKHRENRYRSGECLVEGTVLSASDVPVPGIKVTLVGPSLDMSSYGASPAMEVWASAESDADGRFEFSKVAVWPYMTLRADTEGAAASALLDSVGDELHKTVTLKLAPAGAIKGLVLDPEGAPVAEALVIPFAVTPDPAQSKPVMVIGAMPAKTAADGTFICAGLATGYWMFFIEAPGFLKERTEPKYAVGGNAEIRLKSRGAVVTGNVVDATTGRPVPDVVVTAAPDEDSAAFGGPMSEGAETKSRAYLMNPSKIKTGPDGTFRLSGLTTGQYNVGTPDAVALWELDEEEKPESQWCLMGSPAKVSVREGAETSAGTLQVAPSGAISGRVVWAGTDEPVSEATVIAFLGSQDSSYTSKPTGPDGLYRLGGLPPGNLKLVLQNEDGFTSDDERIVQIKPGAVLDGIDLTMKKPLGATGTVLDANRQPVAGARVNVVGMPRFSKGAESGADGAFRIEDLPEFMPPRIAAFKDEMTSESVEVTAESHESLVLVLRKGATVSGTLVDEIGRPIANAVVVAMTGEGIQQDSRQGKETDSTGTFKVAGLAPGTYDLYAEIIRPDAHTEDSESQKEEIAAIRKKREEELGASLPPEIIKEMEGESNEAEGGSAAEDFDYPVDPSGVAMETVELAWGQNVTGMKLVLKTDTSPPPAPQGASEVEAYILKGRVVDESGKPIAGAGVGWYFGEEMDDGTMTASDAEGRFEIPAFDGLSALKAVHPEYGRGYATAHAGQQDIQIVLKRAGSIRGKVVDATGKAIVGCEVGFKEGARAGDGLWDTELPQNRPDTDALFESLPEDMKDIVNVEEVSSAIQSAQVSSERPWNFAEIHDPKGEFVLNNVPAGKATVFAMAKGYAIGCTQVDVPSGRAAENVVVKLKKGAGVKGLVVDSSGQPVAQAAIIFENELEPIDAQLPMRGIDGALATSDEQGRFTVDTLLPGTTRLWAQHPQYAPGAATVVKGQMEVRIVLSTGGAVEGVVTAEGKPAPDAMICFFPSRGEHDSVESPLEYEVSAPGGRFRVEHLPEGTFELEVFLPFENPDQYSAESFEVIVENGKTATVEIALEPEDPGKPVEGDPGKHPIDGDSVELIELSG